MVDNKENKKRKIVLTSGVFDLLHLGHVRFLEEAKKKGGKNARLIVVVARDTTAERRKQKNTVMSENQRRALVESLKVVDKAILGYKNFKIGEVIERVNPDIIAFGYDQNEMKRTVEKYLKRKKLGIEIVEITKFEEDELDSSSKIKRRIVQNLVR